MYRGNRIGWQNKNKSNSTSGAKQVQANLQDELGVHIHFRKRKCYKKRRIFTIISHVAQALTVFKVLQFPIFLRWKSRSRSLGVSFAMANIKIYKSRYVQFCASSQRFRDINSLRVWLTKSWPKSQSIILAMTPFDGKRQKTPRRFWASSYHFGDIII